MYQRFAYLTNLPKTSLRKRLSFIHSPIGSSTLEAENSSCLHKKQWKAAMLLQIFFFQSLTSYTCWSKSYLVLPLFYINLNLDKNLSYNDTLSRHINYFVKRKAQDLLLRAFITKPSRSHKQEHRAIERNLTTSKSLQSDREGRHNVKEGKWQQHYLHFAGQIVCIEAQKNSAPSLATSDLARQLLMLQGFSCVPRGSPAPGLKREGLSISSNLV